MKTTGCLRCGRQIVWCVTVNGKAMPLDPEPNQRGNVFCRFEGRGKLVGRVRIGEDPRPPGTPFMPHFATCGTPGYEPKPPAAPAAPEPVQHDLFTQPQEDQP